MAGGDPRAAATSPLANTARKTRPFGFSDPAGCPRSCCRRPDLWAIIKPAEAAASAHQMPGTLRVLQPPPACWAARAPGASRDHPGVRHHEVLDVPPCSVPTLPSLCWCSISSQHLAKAPPGSLRPRGGRIPPVPSCAGRWGEVMAKLLREVSINAVLENIMVCGNLFVIVN